MVYQDVRRGVMPAWRHGKGFDLEAGNLDIATLCAWFVFFFLTCSAQRLYTLFYLSELTHIQVVGRIAHLDSLPT